MRESRLAATGQAAVTLVAMLVLYSYPLADWARLLGLAALPLASWLEWRARPRLEVVHFQPGSLSLVLADGSRWQVPASSPAVCYPMWITLRAERLQRRRWLTLYRDQLPAQTWRRLSVVLRWR